MKTVREAVFWCCGRAVVLNRGRSFWKQVLVRDDWVCQQTHAMCGVCCTWDLRHSTVVYCGVGRRGGGRNGLRYHRDLLCHRAASNIIMIIPLGCYVFLYRRLSDAYVIATALPHTPYSDRSTAHGTKMRWVSNITVFYNTTPFSDVRGAFKF